MLRQGQDAVPRSGKFWRLYSRPGNVVIINSQGDLLVRCSPSLHQLVHCTCLLSTAQLQHAPMPCRRHQQMQLS